jgi:transposase
MNVRYRVELSQAERDELTAMLGGGKHAARKLKRAQILLAADAGSCDAEIVRTVRVSLSTVGRTKRRLVEGNLERALNEEPRPGAERKLTGKEEALLVATACAKPPAGRKRWTLTLLADAMVKFTDHDSLSSETVRRRLAVSSRGAGTCGAFPALTANRSPVWRMCSISTPRRRTRSGRWSASTRPLSSSLARCVSRSQPNRDSTSATITSTAATAPSISLLPSIRIVAGATSRLQTVAPP